MLDNTLNYNSRDMLRPSGFSHQLEVVQEDMRSNFPRHSKMTTSSIVTKQSTWKPSEYEKLSLLEVFFGTTLNRWIHKLRFLIILLVLGSTGYLGYKCYTEVPQLERSEGQ